MEHQSQPDHYIENDINNYFKIRKTFLKMLEDRGYSIPSEEKEKRLEEWKANFKKENLCFLTAKKNKNDDLIYVEFNSSQKLGVSDINTFAHRLYNEKIKNGIIIVKGTITALAKQKLSDLDELLHLEYFEEKELLVNITEHELVPKHYPLSDEDKKDLLKK
jgi:DNA-directed RNA polymerase I, II, and III subunit RPABC1